MWDEIIQPFANLSGSTDEVWNEFVIPSICYWACDWLSMLVPGDRLNKKDGLTRYGDSHVKDKTS